MIKPKSRKHEERIKALENECSRLVGHICALYKECSGLQAQLAERKPWWQFWR